MFKFFKINTIPIYKKKNYHRIFPNKRKLKYTETDMVSKKKDICTLRFKRPFISRLVPTAPDMLDTLKFGYSFLKKVSTFYLKKNQFFFKKLCCFVYLNKDVRESKLYYINGFKLYKLITKSIFLRKKMVSVFGGIKKSLLDIISLKNTDKLQNFLYTFFGLQNFKKHRKLYFLFKTLLNLSTPYLKRIFNLSGLHLIIKGKFNNSGNAKKRKLVLSVGRYSSTGFNSLYSKKKLGFKSPQGLIAITIITC